MTTLASVNFTETDLDAIATAEGRVAVFVTPDGKLDQAGRRVNRLTKGTLARLIDAGTLDEKSPDDVVTLDWPAGMAARALDIVVLPKTASVEDSRRAGVALGRNMGEAGLETMTMDMAGAGVVAGVMHSLARRQAQANVVGLVGLVENMVSDRATRPGDVVTSMKGDTIEVINTDAEGRMVLADVLWYAQETYTPRGVIDLATLTGAAIVALGHENAAALSTDDTLCDGVLKAARAEGEGLWRLPLGKAYADMMKSRIADVKNSGGRPAGTITAAEFLHRFVRDDMPWVHLDIAGVARTDSETPYAPKGASGWGVMTLNRLVADMCES
ncbi:MAG: M17 family metallopeptidase [Gemmatimonadales bacterium]